MVIPPMFGALRRVMRRHQGLAPRAGQIPMWRLLGGELVWAARQLVSRPWVLVGLVAGFAATFAVLGAAAPGPILEVPWSVLVATAAGLSVAAGVRQVETWRSSTGPPQRAGDTRPLIGAALISAAVTVITLSVWLVVWLVQRLS